MVGEALTTAMGQKLETFELHWPIGTPQRLAFALLLYSFQRRGDVIRMWRQQLAQGCLTIVQHKTKAKLTIPVHPDLQRIIDATPVGLRENNLPPLFRGNARFAQLACKRLSGQRPL